MEQPEALHDLIRILSGQRDCYVALLRLAEEKHRALGVDDIQALEHSLDQEQVLIRTLGVLENQRQSLIPVLAQHLGIPREELRAETLLELIDPINRRRLTGLRDEINSFMQQWQEVNTANQQLLERELRKVNLYLHVLGARSPQPVTYGKGEQALSSIDNSKSRFLDRKL